MCEKSQTSISVNEKCNNHQLGLALYVPPRQNIQILSEYIQRRGSKEINKIQNQIALMEKNISSENNQIWKQAAICTTGVISLAAGTLIFAQNFDTTTQHFLGLISDSSKVVSKSLQESSQVFITAAQIFAKKTQSLLNYSCSIINTSTAALKTIDIWDSIKKNAIIVAVTGTVILGTAYYYRQSKDRKDKIKTQISQ